MHFEVLKDGVKINPTPYIDANLYTEFVTVPNTRNDKAWQIEVKTDILRVRSSPFGKILGFCAPGIYNILEEKENGGYTWYRIDKDMWIAHSIEWSVVYDLDTTMDNMVIPNEIYKPMDNKIKEEKSKKILTIKDRIKLWLKDIFKSIFENIKRLFELNS